MGIGVSINNAFNLYKNPNDGSTIQTLIFTDQNGRVFGRLSAPFPPFQTFTSFTTFPTSFTVTAVNSPTALPIQPVVSNRIRIDGTSYSLQLTPGIVLALSSQNQEFISPIGVTMNIDPTVIANFEAPFTITTPFGFIRLDRIPSTFTFQARLGDSVSVLSFPKTLPTDDVPLGVANTIIIAKPTINLITGRSLTSDNPIGITLVQGELNPNPTPIPIPLPIVKRSAIININNRCNGKKNPCKGNKRIV